MATIGVLALQGAFREHAEVFGELGALVVHVRHPDQLGALDAIVLPGGESTAQEKLLDAAGLREPLTAALAAGMPTLATCAGLILLAREITDGRPDQKPFGVLDVSVRRNGYGRQVMSFETPLDIGNIERADGPPFNGIFIRAPRIEDAGDVEVLIRYGDDPVLVRSGSVVGLCFHPELSGDSRIHQWFVREVLQ